MEERVVIVLVGYPGCGKTTFAHVHYPNYIRLDGDSLKTSKNVVKSLVQALDTTTSGVIVDATNMTIDRRRPLIAECKKRNIKIYCVYFNLSAEICMQRSNLREQQAIQLGQIPKHIPKIAYYKLRSQFVMPTVDEGFEYVGITA